MRLRCRLGIHVYDRLGDSIYHECVWCGQLFYLGDNSTLNVTKRTVRDAEHRAYVAAQRAKADRSRGS